MSARLRLGPMGVGEILAASATVYVRRWRTLVAIAGVLVLPYAVLYLIMAESPAEISALPTEQEMGEILSAMAPWLLVRLFIVSVLFAAVARTVVETYVDVESSWRVSAASAISRMASLAVVTVLYWSGTTLGSMLFVLPGIFLMVAWSACLPVLIIEGVGPVAAIRRSWQITSGRRMPMFGVLLAASLIVIIGSAATYVASGALLGALLGDLGWRLASEVSWVMVEPFIGVVLGVAYLDLLVRKEDLDLDWLSLQLAATSLER